MMEAAIAVNAQERLGDLIPSIEQGRILDAMNRFYADDVKMQENDNLPTIVLAANIEREKRFLSSVREWEGFEVTAIGDGFDITSYEVVMDRVTTDDIPVHLKQVVIAKWEDGKIVHERFFYNTAST